MPTPNDERTEEEWAVEHDSLTVPGTRTILTVWDAAQAAWRCRSLADDTAGHPDLHPRILRRTITYSPWQQVEPDHHH